ncbi:triosephosphate isomerase [Thermodesulfobium narugense DSM 14796]|uniref:Triosephosphate isomerase n=1 Tax=Thermodesulfobium narugense DSM 14796 TaxID=747365 RepID=M1E9G5_9BACT|nr:triose-phosphate isomerase [Thermodesulfobium narugense]AEE15239.1 triosephosphate isomerase [Thermodesulfobium narugense DSM 14796]
MNYAIANFKMNKTSDEVDEYICELRQNLKNSVKTVICPSFVSLERAVKASFGSLIEIGAQNLFFEEKGAFTGEISIGMLESVGVKYAIIGHSERRHYFKESDDLLFKKVKAAANRLKVIYCFGETEEERDAGKSLEVTLNQLNLVKSFFENIILAYEPVWAIGTGKTANAEGSFALIKELESKLGALPDCLYGGSVNHKNAKSFIDAGFKGVLVGSASLDVKEFSKIIENMS